MASNQKSASEVRAEKAMKRGAEARTALSEAQAEARRVADNTARLRALRLAKEAAEAAAAAANPAPKKKARARAAAKAIPVAALNASNDD